MTIDRIEYTDSFQVSESQWRKIMWSASILPTDDPETETENLKNRIEELRKKFNEYPIFHPVTEAIPIEQIKKEPKEAAIDSHIEAIVGCASLESLGRFKKLVDRENVPRLTEAYFKKQQSLSNE